MPMNRRVFLGTAAGAALHGAAPSDRLRLGFIACGGRARYPMSQFAKYDDVDIVAISDAIEPRLDQTQAQLAKLGRPQTPERYVGYERMLERKDVDAVVVATQHHWHARPFIQACQAGKHVYVEKPLSHTVPEGRAMVKAVKKHGVVAMMGTQQRGTEHFQKAIEVVRSGRLGKIAMVECWNCKLSGTRAGRRPDEPTPAGYHWDLWLGSAPVVPYNPGRLHNNFWFWDYGGGMMTDWGVHLLDVVVWAMQPKRLLGVTCTGGKYAVDDMADAPDTLDASFEFPDFLATYRYRSSNNFFPVQHRPWDHGLLFCGTKATLVLDRLGYEVYEENTKPKRLIEKVDLTDEHAWYRTFVDCVKDRKAAPMELEECHQSTTLCNLANISYRTGERIRWNSETESIVGSVEGSKLLSPGARKGYETPKV